MGLLLAQLHPQWAAHVVIDAQTGAFLLSGATDAQFERWCEGHRAWRNPSAITEVRPDLRPAYSQADSCTHYLVEDAP